MALVKYGGVAIDVRGKIAGNVFSRNSYGSYIRALTKPVNPNTEMQQNIRGVMQSITTRWNQTLTEAQRDGWNVYAAAITWQNRLGDDIQLTGFNMFVRSNLAILYAGLTEVDDGPAELSLPNADDTLAITAEEAAQELSVAFDDALDWLNEAGGALVIFAGTPVTKTTNYFDGPWKIAGTIEGDATTPPTTPAVINNPYQVSEGQKQFYRARILRADGRVTRFFRTSGLVTS